MVLIFIAFFFSAIVFADKTTTDTVKQKAVVVRTPEKLFKTSCAICHSIGKGKLIGPDLIGVDERHSQKWLINFIHSSDSMIKSGDTSALRLYNEYRKLPMPNHNFSKEESKTLIDYIVSEGNKIRINPNFLDNKTHLLAHSNNWIFILAIYLILFALADLIFTKFIKYRIINVAMMLIGMALIGKIVFEESVLLGRSQGYSPDQPIKFSHKQHAGDNKINCVYCHTGVYDSKYASIPPATLCLNCHNVIRKGTNTGEKEIDKIHEAIKDGKPIKWVRVYNLADFVVFNHA